MTQTRARQLADDLHTYNNPKLLAQAAAELRRLSPMEARVKELEDALRDTRGGLIYIRDTYGDLYGVGWDRAIGKATESLAQTTEVAK